MYSIKPFSGPNYIKNSLRCDKNRHPCAICGKPLDVEKVKYWVVVVNGGADWGNEDSEQDSGYMGSFPVGNDCHRKYIVKGD